MDDKVRQRRIERSRVIDRINTNPLLPLGVGCTIAALAYNILTSKDRATNKSLFWCKTRVLAQGSAIAVLSLGSIYKIYEHITEDEWPPKFKKSIPPGS